MEKETNCKNCGAPLIDGICDHCGTGKTNKKEYETINRITPHLPSASDQFKEPHVFTIFNSSNNRQHVILFGTDKIQGKSNYGNDKSVLIKATGEYNNYTELLEFLSENRLRIGKLRFNSKDQSQFNEIIRIVQTDASGKDYSIPMILRNVMDPYRQSAENVDLIRTLIIDNNTSLEFNLGAGTELIIMLFPYQNDYKTGILQLKSDCDYKLPTVDPTKIDGYTTKKKMKFWSTDGGSYGALILLVLLFAFMFVGYYFFEYRKTSCWNNKNQN